MNKEKKEETGFSTKLFTQYEGIIYPKITKNCILSFRYFQTDKNTLIIKQKWRLSDVKNPFPQAKIFPRYFSSRKQNILCQTFQYYSNPTGTQVLFITNIVLPVALIVIVSADIEKKKNISARPNFPKTSDHGFKGFHTSQKLGKWLQVRSNFGRFTRFVAI